MYVAENSLMYSMQVPAVVGGRAIMEKDDNPSRLATYGKQGESAVEAGQQVMKDAEGREDRTGLAGNQYPPDPSAEFRRSLLL
jgi:hypothetical protein